MKKIYIVLFVLLSFAKNASAQYLGEIRIISGNVVPRGWLLCDGRILNINQNMALYSILNTKYGGNGVTTFALPDLRGRAAIGKSGATTYGQKGGTETIPVTNDNLPVHNHDANPIYLPVSSYAGSITTPYSGDIIAAPEIFVGSEYHAIFGFNNQNPDQVLAPIPTSADGGVASPQGLSVMQPYIGINYIICNSGEYTFPPN